MESSHDERLVHECAPVLCVHDGFARKPQIVVLLLLLPLLLIVMPVVLLTE